jgi:hypothetical protein
MRRVRGLSFARATLFLRRGGRPTTADDDEARKAALEQLRAAKVCSTNR